ncbi:Homeodomain-like DNA binding domain-containing transcription factor [Phycomyces blakesleeanus NRRL 1555(-)]|uniref:Homeodomain-like DNA binding domain-containing transcription factor n=1 Tax=Phycomyces blakesleeanus (strain ATCC 8743b / DSM 1359 / FGSC 10004 / NBRC 33097 / NRRL 1555) TaxID=763407 RepID=A0A162PH00_PHYB8|nr:Homeodomain-like DNA binding domain-containing transcription factor [Phycomyces blakesleeanus NRRL 1555(-)]OAD72737.1 Homeodomain-like DNA binding domain-containing transcription factor [Phycomyces blakesleeanus NRRL 1555(-)]|eukprot:XP_018290777.1 Homeodomain-like DNA binding domain-containing transcription factor [Phycomyces blakesleeanus NRRL 1555(-)]
MSPISHEKAFSIEAHLRQGESAAKVASIVGVSDTTVKRHRRKLGIPAFEGKGRPPQIDPKLARRIIRAFKREDFTTTKEAENQLCSEGFTVKAPAIRTLLKTSGFTCQRQHPPKVKNRPSSRRQRMLSVRNSINLTEEDQEPAASSDESKVNNLGSDRQEWKWIFQSRLPRRTRAELLQHVVNMLREIFVIYQSLNIETNEAQSNCVFIPPN